MLDNIWTKFIAFMYYLSGIFKLTSPGRVVIFVVDILIVSFIVYYVYRLIKQTRAEQIVKGVLILFVLLIISKIFDMVILNFILTNLMTYSMLLFIVIFQPELRSAFEKLGRNKLKEVFDVNDKALIMHSISEITKSVEIMSLKKIGALIVIERETKISEIVKEGIDISAKVSSELLQNIFVPRTPLHDGAVIIRNNQISAAKCILPLASENNVPKSLGTRHRAAVGISEIADVLVVVVSEETGTISLAEDGKLKRDLNADSLKDLLTKKLIKANNSKFIKTKKQNV